SKRVHLRFGSSPAPEDFDGETSWKNTPAEHIGTDVSSRYLLLRRSVRSPFPGRPDRYGVSWLAGTAHPPRTACLFPWPGPEAQPLCRMIGDMGRIEMLIVSLKKQNRLRIGGDFTLEVLEITPDRVRLGIVPPLGTPIELGEAEGDANRPAQEDPEVT